MKQIPLKTSPRKSLFLFKARSSKGLTLMEIIIATLIFALVMAGLVNLFMAAKRLTLHARSRMQASELGKQFLDPLQMQVRQDQWGANCLGTGVCAPAVWVLAPITYNAAYVVTGVAGTTLRRVDVTINWNEPQ
jgi:Tfp pilus assembly protein PilV